MLFLELILQKRLGALLRAACCVRSHCNANAQQAAYPRAQLRECTPWVGALDSRLRATDQKKKKRKTMREEAEAQMVKSWLPGSQWSSLPSPRPSIVPRAHHQTQHDKACHLTQMETTEKSLTLLHPQSPLFLLLLQKQPNLTSKLLGLYSHYSPESSAWLWQPSSQTHVQVKCTFLTSFYSQYLRLTFLFSSSFFIPFLLCTEDKYYR